MTHDMYQSLADALELETRSVFLDISKAFGTRVFSSS